MRLQGLQIPMIARPSLHTLPSAWELPASFRPGWPGLKLIAGADNALYHAKIKDETASELLILIWRSFSISVKEDVHGVDSTTPEYTGKIDGFISGFAI